MTHDEDKTKAFKYLDRLLPEVRLWRNKIGAHFTRSSPTTKDNEADQQLSVMNPIEYHSGSFHAGSAVFAIFSSSGVNAISNSKQSMMWSLTETHEKLTARYWPEKADQKELVSLS